ncbi:MAG: protein translocase subunit SecF, partial [Gammaproteobacteria bacterium]
MAFFAGLQNIDFMRRRKIAGAFSIAMVLASIALLLVRGLNFGVDFTGGVLVEVGYPEAVELNPVRDALGQGGFNQAVVQHFGSAREVLVRLPQAQEGNPAEMSASVMHALRQMNPAVEMRRVEFVGPAVGEELREDGGLAVLFALIAILIYVAMRFEWRLALGSVVALIHDVLITLGMFALLQAEFDLSVLAAVLAVIGYSLNDTIVVFDRIRENFRRMRKGSPVEIVNRSLNQTLSRTLMTSATTMLVLIALFFLGGEIIHGFSLALILGIFVGTYSSIYVASTAALALGISKQD